MQNIIENSISCNWARARMFVATRSADMNSEGVTDVSIIYEKNNFLYKEAIKIE